MKTEEKFDLDDEALTTMIRGVMSKENGGREGRSTYLRTLVAAVQTEIGGKPVISPPQPRKRKARAIEDVLKAVATVNSRFYALVLAQLDPDLDPLSRNAQSSFARSSVSTLRSAVRAGLNPMIVPVATLTKEWLRKWTEGNRPARPMDAKRGLKQAHKMVKALLRHISPLSELEKVAVIDQVRQELDGLVTVATVAPKANGHIVLARRATDQRMAA